MSVTFYHTPLYHIPKGSHLHYFSNYLERRCLQHWCWWQYFVICDEASLSHLFLAHV